MSAIISSINYCPVKSVSFQTIEKCEIKKDVGIIGDRIFAFAKDLDLDKAQLFEKNPEERKGKWSKVLNVIRSLNKEHDLTMIMVTHQMGFAREISDRVCFFNEGKIFEQGPPEQLFDNPQNERTKQFLHAVLDAN